MCAQESALYLCHPSVTNSSNNPGDKAKAAARNKPAGLNMFLPSVLQVAATEVRVCVPSTPEQDEAPSLTVKASKPGPASLERPEELVPELVAFLKGHPEIRGVAKAVQVRLLVHIKEGACPWRGFLEEVKTFRMSPSYMSSSGIRHVKHRRRACLMLLCVAGFLRSVP